MRWQFGFDGLHHYYENLAKVDFCRFSAGRTAGLLMICVLFHVCGQHRSPDAVQEPLGRAYETLGMHDFPIGQNGKSRANVRPRVRVSGLH